MLVEYALMGVAFVLLLAGVVGSLVPQIPGAIISLAGVGLYWAATGFVDPGAVVLGGLVAVGVLTLAVDWLGGVAAARIGGVSTVVAFLAGLVGFVATLLWGPLGVLAIGATVFLIVLLRERDPKAGLKGAAVTTLAILGTAVLQAVLTGTMLVTMVVVHLV